MVSRNEATSILAVDIGSAFTKAVLFDMVEGQRRFVARTEVPTSFPAGDVNVYDGTCAAIHELEQVVGRPLLTPKGALILPERSDGSGVDDCFVVTSVQSTLRVLAVAANAAKTEELEAEIRAVPGHEIVATIGLAVEQTSRPTSRIENLVTALHRERPDVLVIASEGAEPGELVEVAQCLAVSVRTVVEDVTVVLAGAEDAAIALRQTMPSWTRLYTVPRKEMPSGLSPLQERLGTLWQERWHRHVGGAEELHSSGFGLPWPVQLGFANALRFVAQSEKTDIWGMDIGASNSTAVSVLDGALAWSTRSDLGVGKGGAAIIDKVEAIARWLPFESSASEAADSLLHKQLHPTAIPESRAKLEMEGALLREIAGPAISRLPTRSTQPSRRAAMLVACGSVFTKGPSLGYTCSMMLDAFQPAGLVELAIDRLGILPVLGIVALRHPAAASELVICEGLERLGSCLALGGTLRRPDVTAAKITLEYDREKIQKKVPYGKVEVLPLGTGAKAKMTVKPEGKLDGGAGPGRKAVFTVSGGPLGFVVDTRGRPIDLSGLDEDTRISRILAWREGLGA